MKREELEVKDWTCSNCGHQSPVETFDIFDKMQAKIDKLEKQLEETENIVNSIKNIRFATNRTGTAIMVRDSLIVEAVRDDARQYFKNKEKTR